MTVRPAGTRAGDLRGWWDRAAVAVCCAAAGLTFAGAFEPGVLSWTVPAAAVIAALAYPSRGFVRGALPRAATAAVPVLCAVAVPIVFAGQPVEPGALLHGSGWRELADVLLHGPGRILRLTLPLPPRYSLVPTLLAGLAAVLGASLVQRRPGGLVALLPAAACAGYGVVGSGAAAGQRLPVLLAAPAVALLVLRGAAVAVPAAGLPADGVRPARRVRTLTALSWVAVAALPLWWLPDRPAGRPVDVRAALRAPVRVAPSTDLLDRLAGWLSASDTRLFRVTTDGTVARWRLAVLDRYDGARWTSSARFTRAGLGVPPPPAGPTGTDPVRQHVQLDALDGPFLPAADRPVRVSAVVTAVDPVDGVLVTDRPVSTGTRYQVTSLPPADPGVPARATAAPGAADELDVPGPVAADLDRLWRAVPVRPEMTVAERAVALDRYLRQHRRNAVGAASGGGIGAVRSFLTDRGEGTTVQFAVTFVLAMRHLGVPARVVVGFVAGAAARLPDGSRPVVGRDARAWAQLRYVEHGWVTYDPTPPPTRRGERPAPPEPLRVAPPPPPPPPPPPVPDRTPVQRFLSDAHSRLPLGTFAALGLLLVAGYVGTALGTPLVRRAWRRRPVGTADEQVVRAWHDLLDELAVELPALNSRAAAQVRLPTATPMATRTLIGALPRQPSGDAEVLTALADGALYGPRPSTADDVRRAWRDAGRLRRAVRRVRPAHRRWRNLLAPVRLRWTGRRPPGR